ncbi:mCG147399 [Mus musculus]|nr:mCG147399 [Mus musculus]
MSLFNQFIHLAFIACATLSSFYIQHMLNKLLYYSWHPRVTDGHGADKNLPSGASSWILFIHPAMTDLPNLLIQHGSCWSIVH